MLGGTEQKAFKRRKEFVLVFDKLQDWNLNPGQQEEKERRLV